MEDDDDADDDDDDDDDDDNDAQVIHGVSSPPHLLAVESHSATWLQVQNDDNDDMMMTMMTMISASLSFSALS